MGLGLWEASGIYPANINPSTPPPPTPGVKPHFTDTPLRRTLSVPPSVSVLKGVLLYLQSLALLIGANRVLKQWSRRRQRVRQESNGFRLAKQQLCTCIMLFWTFVNCRCMTTTWECLFFTFFKDGNTRQQHYYSFPELWYSPLEFNSKKICQHLTNFTTRFWLT